MTFEVFIISTLFLYLQILHPKGESEIFTHRVVSGLFSKLILLVKCVITKDNLREKESKSDSIIFQKAIIHFTKKKNSKSYFFMSLNKKKVIFFFKVKKSIFTFSRNNNKPSLLDLTLLFFP